MHFEESQFERLCEERKLRKNAIPTLFSVPNVPSLLTEKRQKGYGSPKPGTLLETLKRKRVTYFFLFSAFCGSVFICILIYRIFISFSDSLNKKFNQGLKKHGIACK